MSKKVYLLFLLLSLRSASNISQALFFEEPSCFLVGFLFGIVIQDIDVIEEFIEDISEDEEEAEDTTVNPCIPDPCNDNGRCVINGVGEGVTAECICNPGFCGDTCTPSTVTTGTNCDANDLCRIPGSICVEEACVCDCDDIYVDDLKPNTAAQTRNACVRDCPNGYSNVFTRYDGNIIDDDNGVQLNGIASREACETECLNYVPFFCRSYEYNDGSNRCTLNRARKDDPVRFITSTTQDFGERGCL